MSNIASVTQPPTALFQGYDSFLGQARGAALKGQTSQSNGQTYVNVTLCTDTSSVQRALSASAAVSDGFADFSVSAKASFAQSLNLSSTSVVVIVNAVHVTGETQQDGTQLQVAAPATAQDFFNLYGDSFVSAIVLGGQYYAAFVFDAESTEQQTQISTQLSGSMGTLTASLSATLTSTASSSSTNMRMSQTVIGLENPPSLPDDANSIVSFGLSFGTLTIDAPQVLCFALTGYENAITKPDFSAVAANRALLGTNSMTPWVDATNALASLASQVSSIQSMYTSYGYTGDTLFAKNAALISTDQNTLSELIQSIEGNVTGTNKPPVLASLTLGMPMPSFALNPTTAPASPIPNSTPFFDLTPGQVAVGTKPASITLFGSSGVPTGISVVYSDGTTVTHGTSSTTVGPLTIASEDSINKVWMVQGINVIDLYIQTASGLSIGVENPGGAGFTAPPAIIGFTGNLMSDGSGGTLIATFAPITVTVANAVWVTRPATGATARRTARASQPAQARA